MQNKHFEHTWRMVLLALLAALAYLVMVFIKIPVVLFLSYEPKDVLLAIAGLLLGPWAGVSTSFVVSLVEMFTVSTTGIWGLVMNVLSTCTFLLPAALLYRRRQTVWAAGVGLLLGAVLMAMCMLAWNYLISPIYMGIPREDIVPLLWSAFLPFNLLKGGINAVLTFALFPPLRAALRRAKLLPQTGENKE